MTGSRPRTYSLSIVANLALATAGITCLGSVGLSILSAYRVLLDARVVWLMAEPSSNVRMSPLASDFQSWQQGLSSYSQLEAFATAEMLVRSSNLTERVHGVKVTQGCLGLAGVLPLSGRPFASSDVSSPNVVAITEALAERAFPGTGSPIGEVLSIDRRPFTVVAILPREFGGALGLGERFDLVLPARVGQEKTVQVLARLKTGVTREQAQLEVNTWALGRPRTAEDGSLRWLVLSGTEMVESDLPRLVGASALAVILLLVATGANLSHFIFAQNGVLSREHAIRWALGASSSALLIWRLRLATMQALAGSVLGALLSLAGLPLVLAYFPERLRIVAESSINPELLLGSSVSGVLFCGACALPWALQPPGALAGHLATDPRFEGPSRLGRIFSGGYLVSLAACSSTLGVLAFLVLRSADNITKMPLGFELEGLDVIKVELPEWKYPSQERRAVFFDGLRERLSANEEERAFAFASTAPPGVAIFTDGVRVSIPSPRIELPKNIGMAYVTANYFSTLRQPLLAGRDFLPQEVLDGASVAVISEALSRVFGEEPRAAIGQHVSFGLQFREVVGVVGDVRAPGITSLLKGFQAYLPFSHYRKSSVVVLRSERERSSILAAAISNVDSDVVMGPAPIDTELRRSTADSRFLAALMAVVAAVAGTLNLLGVYAIVSIQTLRERAAISMRMVLGATSGDLLRWVVWRALARCLVGLAIGTAVSFPLARLLAGTLVGVQVDSALARALPVAILVAGAAIAAALPAIRATRLPPSHVLRHE